MAGKHNGRAGNFRLSAVLTSIKATDHVVGSAQLTGEAGSYRSSVALVRTNAPSVKLASSQAQGPRFSQGKTLGDAR